MELFTIFLTILTVLTTACTSSQVYQLANSDLLKGVLLGAIIASQQNHNRTDHIPNPLLDIIQKSIAGRFGGAYEQQMDGSEPKAVTEKIETQNWLRTAVTPNYFTKPMTVTESPIYSSQSLSALTPESTKPITNHFSLPLQNMVVMLMPSREHESSILDAIQKHMIMQTRKLEPEKFAENESENSETVTVKTNAINIGSHDVNLKGWKPVVTNNDNSNVINANKRYGRPYIEKSEGYLQSFIRRENV